MLEEANFICHKIRFLHLKKGIKLEEIAVIIKGLGYETHLVENALIQNGIPSVRRGTRSLLDNKLIKYLLNLMRLILAVKELEESKKYTLIMGIELKSGRFKRKYNAFGCYKSGAIIF